MSKKVIKCKFKENFEWTKKILEERYALVESESPDFVFFGCGSQNDCVDYNCVRIILMGENQRPNFNLFDYAAGFDQIQYEDRYLYFPLYVTGG